jgi:hypothetical protein
MGNEPDLLETADAEAFGLLRFDALAAKAAARRVNPI